MMYPKITEEAIPLFQKHYYSLQMIAEVFGVSRVGVKKFLNKNGVDTSRGREFWQECEKCGARFRVQRKELREEKRRFCSRDCYRYALREGGIFEANRTGARRSRLIVNEFFPLEEGMVVHHEDGKQANYRIDNLKVFRNHKEHIQYHRRQPWRRPKPVWEGSVMYG